MSIENAPSRYVELRGSARSKPVDSQAGDVDRSIRVMVSVYLRGPEIEENTRTDHDAFISRFGANSDDVAQPETFATTRHLTVGDVDLARRRVELSGTLGDLANAFGVELSLHDGAEEQQYRARQGSLSVPAELEDIVRGVFGLDNRPQATPKFRVAATPSTSYTPPKVAAAYSYPVGMTGKGECVALIELGGGFRADDITAYFSSLGLSAPTVEAVLVDGATNDPGTSNGPDGEVMLDIEVVGSIAPQATIAVYFAPNTDQGFLDAVTMAVHDTARRPSVVSISWGGAESTWTDQAMQSMEQAFIAAAALGVTVIVASGDNGSTDSVSDGLQHVDFPASAPHALSCGGTRLEIANGSIVSQTVWNDGSDGGATGGGISAVFPVPSYQSDAKVPPSVNPGAKTGRGVPDVAGDADPDSGYIVRVDGRSMVIGGTSAVAPLWSGLVALINEHMGKTAGFLQPLLYVAAEDGTFYDIVSGNNGAYMAGSGWDACTGLGSPNGAALLAALESQSSD